VITDAELDEMERVLKEKHSFKGEVGLTAEEQQMINSRNILNEMVLLMHHEQLIAEVRRLRGTTMKMTRMYADSDMRNDKLLSLLRRNDDFIRHPDYTKVEYLKRDNAKWLNESE